MASLLYPTIDSYWIASCSLSAFDTVPMIPRSIVPLLSQWIATHLIAGRRTIYREVLSTESSRMAVEVFMALGFLTEIPAKDKLAPDTQISLHELGISTSETLIALANNDDGHDENNQQSPPTPVSVGGSQDPETMMQIDAYRLGSISQRESFQNKLVFQKCLKQIKGILPQAKSRQRRGGAGGIPEMEERMVQLVYALRTSSSCSSMDKGRSFRRISEAYSLRR
ncbi:hypothetical protein RO3G_03947 [Lichtheimia corymbifera JMRC:FSU:9682]|uniref:Uncharacterized protein n=1 Tax=Lichtheimia corymbifera JMRC:FSU:9682 TaxID=1263082 RepID=A0A068RNW2_9FUNG|nr:hypothetical protein RO3G_03947 [Lichtheimia corymbifera JMRC:FSU:9682]